MAQRVFPAFGLGLWFWAGLFFVCAQDMHSAGGRAIRAADAVPDFSFANVNEKAMRLAAAPYAGPPVEVPDFLRSLTLEQWRDLRHVPETAGSGVSGPRSITPILPGYIFNQATAINIIDAEGVHELPLLPEMIRTGDGELMERLKQASLGFAGFNVHDNDAAGGDRLLGLMCGAHFLFAGRNARFGPFSRPLLIDIATQSGEIYTAFREYWIRGPDGGDGAITVFALMDSPAMTGAFEFGVTPGTSTVVDAHAVFHPRNGAAPPVKLGVSPLTGMFLFSETGGGALDYRPEVHSCDGFTFTTGEGEWNWIPLRNPERLTVSEFPCVNPGGFGLTQRDADFDHYQDLEKRFDQSSSVWIEPKGDWGAGRFELMEIPGSRDYHSNIMLYWVPDAPPAGDGEGSGARPLVFDYRQYWMPPGVKMHELGAVRDTRIDRSESDGTVTFFIDFTGEELNALSADTGLTSVVDLPEEATLAEKRLVKNPITGDWRLALKLALPHSGILDSLLAARDGPPQLWLSAVLKKGENIPQALTEVWRYRALP